MSVAFASADYVSPVVARVEFEEAIDDPRLAMHYMLTPGESVEDARRWVDGAEIDAMRSPVIVRLVLALLTLWAAGTPGRDTSPDPR